jgi:opacity protein-like surface antigen
MNPTAMGSSNGMGFTGIGMKTTAEINNLNPSNYALISKNSFFYDVGIKSSYNTYENKADSETKTRFNFSNLAFAFSVMDDVGVGLSLMPYSDVGYSILGVQSNIEGSAETFESSISGIGGLNDLKLNGGYGLTSAFRLGFSTSLVFGNIEEKESFLIDNSSFELEQNTNYSGVRFGLGLQYEVLEKVTLGSTIRFPTSLNRTLKRSVLKSLDTATIIVEDEADDRLSDFKLPLELGLGLSTTIFNSLLVNVDYKKNYWSSTGQAESIGSYEDQDIFGLGLEFVKSKLGNRYGEQIRFRTGFNYDTGYLSVNDNKIEGYSLSAGVGFPLNSRSNSLINLSYNYGVTGKVETVLIRENYHLITLNLNLEDAWFVKRKVN